MKPTIPNPIHIAILGDWGSTHPARQNGFAASQVLQNLFEAPVGRGPSGELVPGAAASWSAAPDCRSIELVVDRSRRFSDGSSLEALDFKRSWEEALRIQTDCGLTSMLEFLSEIEGFEEFSTRGELTGVSVLGTDRLSVRFSRPFRMAPEQLTGARFGAFRSDGRGGVLGTGRLVMTEVAPGRLSLVPNEFHEDATRVMECELTAARASELAARFGNGEIDALLNATGSWVSNEVLALPGVETHVGPESAHSAILVNGVSGRILGEPRMRLAVQALFAVALRSNPGLVENARFFSADPQIYLSGQAGRLADADAWRVIEEGLAAVPELVARSAEQPVVFYWAAPAETAWIDVLRRAGVRISERSRQLASSGSFAVTRDDDQYDLMPMSASIRSDDPDGVYHVLGRTGGITNRFIQRPVLSELLDKARSIVGRDAIDEAYREVSLAALREVPWIHLGFSRAVTLYRKDRVTIEPRLLFRGSGRADAIK